MRLEREKAALAAAVTITGTAEDGTPTTITCDQPALAAIATSPRVTPGTRWRIAGAGKAVESALTIRPRAITPADE